MTEKSSAIRLTLLVGAGLVFVLPPVAYILSAVFAGMSPADTAAAVVAQYSQERANLLMAGVLSFAPLFLLLIALWLTRRRLSPRVHQGTALGGLIGIAAVLIWVNFEYWPLFLPGRPYPGFPHGLEMVIGPLFFAPPAALLGAITGALAMRQHKQ